MQGLSADIKVRIKPPSVHRKMPTFPAPKAVWAYSAEEEGRGSERLRSCRRGGGDARSKRARLFSELNAGDAVSNFAPSLCPQAKS